VGPPANFACHAAILGAEVSLVSAVGDDEQGVAALGTLNHDKVNTDGVQRVAAHATGMVSVDLDGEGKPHFKIHEESAWDEIVWTTDLAAQLTTTDAVYFGGQKRVNPYCLH